MKNFQCYIFSKFPTTFQFVLHPSVSPSLKVDCTPSPNPSSPSRLLLSLLAPRAPCTPRRSVASSFRAVGGDVVRGEMWRASSAARIHRLLHCVLGELCASKLCWLVRFIAYTCRPYATPRAHQSYSIWFVLDSHSATLYCWIYTLLSQYSHFLEFVVAFRTES